MSINYELFEKQNTPCLYIYCNKCGLTTKDPNKKCANSNNDATKSQQMKNCSYKKRHHYKVRVKTANGEKQKQLDGSFLDVIKQSYAFRASINNSIEQTIQGTVNTPQKITKSEEIISLSVAFAKFMAFKNNVGVPEYKQVLVSKNYIKELEDRLLFFFDVLKENKIDYNKIPISSLNENHLNLLSKALLKRKYKPRYYNNFFSYLRQMAVFANIHFSANINIELLFKGSLQSVGSKTNIKKLSMQEFNNIISLATERANKNKAKTSFAKKWLCQSFKLAIFTGRRREEIINLKWNQIEFRDGNYYIHGNNLKQSRLRHIDSNLENEYIVPVFPQLLEFLESINLKDNIGKEDYVLDIENRDVSDIKTLNDYMTKAFKHFSTLAGMNYTFYDLKRTFVSNLYDACGEKSNMVSDHVDIKVLQNHYINRDSTHQIFLKNMVLK